MREQDVYISVAGEMDRMNAKGVIRDQCCYPMKGGSGSLSWKQKNLRLRRKK